MASVWNKEVLCGGCWKRECDGGGGGDGGGGDGGGRKLRLGGELDYHQMWFQPIILAHWKQKTNKQTNKQKNNQPTNKQTNKQTEQPCDYIFIRIKGKKKFKTYNQ